MKRVLFSLVFVALSAMTFAQQWTSLGKSTPSKPEVKLVSSSERQIVIDFSLGGFYLNKVNTPNGVQQVVSVPKMASMLEAAAPDLPQFPVPTIIGDLAEMEVNVTKSDFTDYQNVVIAPSKGNFSRQIDPETVPYTYGEMYSRDAFYPAAQAYLETPYILRDFRGQNIMVRPFAYNPVTKTLRVFHNMTIEMRKVSDNGVNQKVSRKAIQKIAPEMEEAYNHRFINYTESTSKYNFIQDRGEMLVICPDQYMESMQPFVEWKNQSGRPTTIVSLSEVGGNNDNQIKNYIQSIYTSPEHNLEFILLVGDYADLTPHSMSGGRSDNWFGQLEGNDYYLEAFTGRFSVQSITDLETHIEKVLYYERDMPEGLTWLNQGIGIAANEGAGNGHNGGEADYVHMNYIRDTLMHYTYENVTQQYSGVGSGTSASAISADINAGKSICNYCNHGSQTSWAVAGYSNSDVNALVNDDKWPFIWSVACNNGEFNGTCFGEAWLRAKNNSTGRPTGAVGGMFSWISQPWQPPMTGQDEMVDILTGWKNSDKYCHTFGGASLNGSMYMLDMHPEDNGNTHNTWILFGDPSLMARTDNPVSMNVTCTPSVLMLGMSELEISAENTAYGIATLMMDGEVIASGTIFDGTCNLSFPPMSNVGNATLTVMGYNKITEVMTVEVLPAEGPYVTLLNYTPNFAPVNMETSLTMSFKNVGVDPTNGSTSVTLTCNDQRLSIINGTSGFGVLNAEETVTLQNEFSFIVADGVEDGTRFQIDVNMTDGRQTWSGRVFITAGQAILEYADTEWAGGFVPGETITFVTNFKNVGHYMATNAIANIACQSEYVTLLNPTIEIGTIDPEGLGTCVFSIQVSENCPETEVIIIDFSMQADGGLSAEGSVTMRNSCNVIFEMADSWGDGWNGASLTVGFSDGTPSANLSCNSSSQTEIIEIGNGTHVTLTWRRGDYDHECSFIVKYETGEVIFQVSHPNPGVLHEFDCNCASGQATNTYGPVENLTAEVEIGSITLSWDAPEGAINYIIRRNGIEIDQTIEPIYTDEVFTEFFYTYCIVAEYADGFSIPECIVVKSDLGIEENETVFAIYPNPVNNVLYINGGNTEYSYMMYNSVGQVVANGNAKGTEQISVDGLTKGIYFLRITSGTQVLVEKVVVK
ncbi:MAG: T9SS type A sorting domain-containing protein [Bacteroidales bacterium]|nr:T9SS type A sorting domain-containing protein [Bacteroidales bacterium]